MLKVILSISTAHLAFGDGLRGDSSFVQTRRKNKKKRQQQRFSSFEAASDAMDGMVVPSGVVVSDGCAQIDEIRNRFEALIDVDQVSEQHAEASDRTYIAAPDSADQIASKMETVKSAVSDVLEIAQQELQSIDQNDPQRKHFENAVFRTLQLCEKQVSTSENGYILRQINQQQQQVVQEALQLKISNEAATKIQSIIRATQAKKQLHRAKTAATKLQSIARGRQAVSKTNQLRREREERENEAAARALELEMQAEYEAERRAQMEEEERLSAAAVALEAEEYNIADELEDISARINDTTDHELLQDYHHRITDLHNRCQELNLHFLIPRAKRIRKHCEECIEVFTPIVDEQAREVEIRQQQSIEMEGELRSIMAVLDTPDVNLDQLESMLQSAESILSECATHHHDLLPLAQEVVDRCHAVILACRDDHAGVLEDNSLIGQVNMRIIEYEGVLRQIQESQSLEGIQTLRENVEEAMRTTEDISRYETDERLQRVLDISERCRVMIDIIEELQGNVLASVDMNYLTGERERQPYAQVFPSARAEPEPPAEQTHECIVCNEEFKASEQDITMSCNHACSDCLKHWLRTPATSYLFRYAQAHHDDGFTGPDRNTYSPDELAPDGRHDECPACRRKAGSSVLRKARQGLRRIPASVDRAFRDDYNQWLQGMLREQEELDAAMAAEEAEFSSS